MYKRSKQIDTLRSLLKLAAVHKFGEDRHSRNLMNELLDAFSVIDEEKIYELVPEIKELLKSPEFVIRDTAIETLGMPTRLHLPEFRDEAYKIWLEDENPMVRSSALFVWGAYYLGSKDPKVLKIFYKILTDENYPVDQRLIAFENIFRVTQEPSKVYHPYGMKHFRFPENTPEEFKAKIDWKEVEDIMRKYAPEVIKK